MNLCELMCELMGGTHAPAPAFARPLWEQHTVGRMYVYDSTLSRVQSSGQLGVNDLASITKAACTGEGGMCYLLNVFYKGRVLFIYLFLNTRVVCYFFIIFF